MKARATRATKPATRPKPRGRSQRKLERRHTPRVKFPRKLRSLWRRARYKVYYGGRGGAKSWGVARALILRATQEKLRILCAREFQNSLADSVHALLKDQIEALGLTDDFDVQKTTITHRETGAEFLFAGLRTNIQSIKSKEGIDIVWVEEAQTVSEKSWSILIPTIRKASSEIWITFNPEHADDPTYKRFVINAPRDAVVVKIGWEDNPWFPKVLRDEKDHAYATDPESAAHIWGGEPLQYSDAQVLRGRYVIEHFDPGKDKDGHKQEGWHGPYHGLDFGFATTPLALVRCWVREQTLYVEHEVAGLEIDNDDMAGRFDAMPDVRKYVIRADCARPETISHLRRAGFTKVIACNKWSGSVEDGVDHLRSYKRIVIHPRCKLAADQAKLWSFKTDKLTGDVLPDLLDKNDDIWDAVRYALEQIIKSGKKKPKPPPPPPKPRDYNRDEREPVEDWKMA